MGEGRRCGGLRGWGTRVAGEGPCALCPFPGGGVCVSLSGHSLSLLSFIGHLRCAVAGQDIVHIRSLGLGGSLGDPHFSGENPGAQRGEVTCSGSHNSDQGRGQVQAPRQLCPALGSPGVRWWSVRILEACVLLICVSGGQSITSGCWEEQRQ